MKSRFRKLHEALRNALIFLWMMGWANMLSAAIETRADGGLGPVDFRYALPWWQSAICLPDDPDKILVGKEGQILCDFGQHGVRNFGLCLQPGVAGPSRWLRQATVSARAPIVQTWMDADGVEVSQQAFVVTPSNPKAHATADEGSAREVIVLITLRNTGLTSATPQPTLRVQSVKPGEFTADRLGIALGGTTQISASEPLVPGGLESATNFVVSLPAATLKPGAIREVCFSIHRRQTSPTDPIAPRTARKLLAAAQRWWETTDLPFDTIDVPDPGIQAMLESCVRNIWQAREIKNGLPAFHVGPTVYRGLWVVDGSFLLESAAILGRAQDARAGIEYLLSHQKPDGSFEIISHFWKENGIVLWAATRHAFLTQDKAWLKGRWPALKRVVQAIQALRQQTSADPKAPFYRLLPPGDVDGGISNRDKPEYSNVYWCLAGLKSVIQAANWLGDTESAATWQAEYDDFSATYRRAAELDARPDKFGNRYIPTMMGNVDQHVPAKGQWAFCHSVYPGQVFAKTDALVERQLAMLKATKVQGMVFDTGWMKEGIWTYFASFYAHAQLWQGRGREAAQVLYDFARHAAPVRVWREEQKPVGQGGAEVGDMPHNWASAEFIRLTTHLLELDRGQELHLLEGFPSGWAEPGMVTRLKGVLTPFGPLHLEVRVTKDGRTAHVKLRKLTSNPPSAIVLHLDGLTGREETVLLPIDRDAEHTVRLRPAKGT